MQQNLPKTSAWRVTSSPHLRARHSVSSIMLDVIIALIPAGIAGVIIFGWRAGRADRDFGGLGGDVGRSDPEGHGSGR